MSGGGQGHPGYLRLLDEIRELHLEKSSGYGTRDDPFHNFTAVAREKVPPQPRHVYVLDRVQEKLARVQSLISQGREDLLEVEYTDMASLLLCATTMLREDRRGADERDGGSFE